MGLVLASFTRVLVSLRRLPPKAIPFRAQGYCSEFPARNQPGEPGKVGA